MNCMEIQGGSGAASNHYSRPGLDIWLSSQSGACSSAGGGDLYLLSSCASGRITRILLADVCSYGTEFSETAGELRDLMKKNINTIRQAKFISDFGKHFRVCSDRGCYATVVLSTYFSPTSTMTLCNAGHAPPLLYRTALRNWSALKQSSVKRQLKNEPLGVVGSNEYQDFVVKLEVGDLVLSYSSALTECRDQEGRTLGSEGILTRLRRLDSGQPDTLIANLTEEIRREHEDNLASEDATIVLSRATQNSVPWRDNLLAPFRYFLTPSDKTRIVSSP